MPFSAGRFTHQIRSAPLLCISQTVKKDADILPCFEGSIAKTDDPSHKILHIRIRHQIVTHQKLTLIAEDHVVPGRRVKSPLHPGKDRRKAVRRTAGRFRYNVQLVFFQQMPEHLLDTGTRLSHRIPQGFQPQMDHLASALFLPIVVGDDNGDGKGDYDEIGYFLQAVGSYSRDVTKEVYVENAVIGKGMRDVNSAEAVRFMMANLGYDLDQYYGLSGILSGYGNAIMANANYASTAKSLEKQFNKLTGKIVEAVEKAVEKQKEYMG